MTPLLRTGAGLWNDFAALIGVSPRHAEAALYSERAARASLSRRSMFGASAALAAGVAFGFPVEPPKRFWYRSTFNNFAEVVEYADADSIATIRLFSAYPEKLLAS